jgi:hypothetical protein
MVTVRKEANNTQTLTCLHNARDSPVITLHCIVIGRNALYRIVIGRIALYRIVIFCVA